MQGKSVPGRFEDGAAVDDAERAFHPQMEAFEDSSEVTRVDRLAIDRGLAADGFKPGAVEKGRVQRVVGHGLIEARDRGGGARQGRGESRLTDRVSV
jgi:hypothetical protein